MSVPQSKLERILAAVRARLEVISTEAGYATDAGDAVYLGAVPVLGPDDDTEAIAVLPAFEGLKNEPEGFIQYTVVLQIQALVFVPSDQLLTESFTKALAMLADIQRAMEIEPRTLGGLIGGNGLKFGLPNLVEREIGSQYVGVQQDYRGLVKHTFGSP